MPYPVINGVTTFLPPPEGYVVDFDNPQKQDALEHYLVFAILGPFALLCLLQRLYTKYFILGSLKIDDGTLCRTIVFILLKLTCCKALIVVAWASLSGHIGKDQELTCMLGQDLLTCHAISSDM